MRAHGRGPFARVALVLLAGLAVIAAEGALPAAESARPDAMLAPPAGMAFIPAGVYRPLFRSSELNARGRARAAGAVVQSGGEPVPPFFLDRYPVTNAEYLAFVREQPRWRRSRVAPIFADGAYLHRWTDDLEPGPQSPARSPVVEVSWFAARAYCKWRGKQLPSSAQWEYAAQADETDANGAVRPEFAARILAWYARPAPPVLPAVGSVQRNLWGVHDLHGLVWEWTLDFNTALVTGESRGDSGLERGLFCGAGSVGAADFNDYAAFVRYAFRSGLRGDFAVSSLGFRCAQAPP